MFKWDSPEELAIVAVALNRFNHTLFGLYIWELVVSLDFDWQYISCKKKFRWPMTFYFLNRYCLLAALVIGSTLANDVKVKVNCQVLFTFNMCLGSSAVGLASINLSLRTMVIWSYRWYIVTPLVMLIIGHWSLLLLNSVLWKMAWIPGVGCVIIKTETKLLAAIYAYSMILDFVVLILTAYKLSKHDVVRSRLVALIFHDGLVYFVIAFLLNVVATVYMFLSPNPIMSIVANIPVAIFSTIVACRAVRRLNTFACTRAELYPTPQDLTGIHRSPSGSGASSSRINKPTSVLDLKKSGGVQVHVHRETFKSSNDGLVQYDMTREVNTGVHFDPEAQFISHEFKPLAYTPSRSPTGYSKESPS